jgi:hypothetical protein
MKKNILHFIKITLALVLFLQAGNGMAQTISFSGGSAATIDAQSTQTACGIAKPAVGTAVLYNNSTITATASVPVTSMSFIVASINPDETHFFDAVGITNETVSVPATCAGLITIGAKVELSGRGISVSTTSTTDVIVTRVTVSSVTPFTQVKMVFDGEFTAAMIGTSGAQASACSAGVTAPSLSAFTVPNVCPATTANLNSLLSSSATAAQVSMLKWFTDAAHTTAVADPTKAPAGTYYAFYYDSTNNCYSPASAAVTATTSTVCSLIIENECPTASVDLAARVTSTASLGYTYTYHSGTPATTSNKISNIVTTSGTYYVASYFAAQDCYTNTSRPMVVTIRDCCSSVVPPTFN